MITTNIETIGRHGGFPFDCLSFFNRPKRVCQGIPPQTYFVKALFLYEQKSLTHTVLCDTLDRAIQVNVGEGTQHGSILYTQPAEPQHKDRKVKAGEEFTEQLANEFRN